MPVVTFTDFQPIPRADGVPFDRARIQEAAAEDGPFTDIEEFSLDPDPLGVPIDADPLHPAARSFTTDEATLDDGWYRIQWLDALDNYSYSEAISSSPIGEMPPTKAELRLRSELLRTTYPATPYDEQKETDLENVRTLAISLVESLTCRTLDASLDPTLWALAIQAIVGKAEQVSLAVTAKTTRARLGFRKLKSISAGPWSETYFGPEEASKAKMLDPDPLMGEILWSLATEECKEKWLALWGMGFAPAATSQEVAWGARGYRGY